jgi:hypothetical protein
MATILDGHPELNHLEKIVELILKALPGKENL